jgi:pyruvate dehydrogenase E2 component (dihydrolipoamide acetyltransferase)
VGASYTDIPLTNMRKVIAQRLTDSKQQLPHFYLTMQVNMDNILKVRQALNEGRSPTDKISINDFIVKACAVAMKAVPEVNSAWHGEFIRRYNNVDISIATATPTGLITPIIANVESKGVSSIAAQVKELAARARRNELKPHEYQGGTFTISNMGMLDVENFSAIINPGESAILAVSSALPTPVVRDNQVVIRNMMKVTLSCDHRVIDGAMGAQFVNAIKQKLENKKLWDSMV